MCNTFNRLLIFLFISFTSTFIHALPTSVYNNERDLYEQVQKNISEIAHYNDLPPELINDIKSLKNYPLYPYIDLSLIKRNIGKRPIKEIKQFISTYKDIPIIHSLRIYALKAKYKSQQWQDVISLYREGDKKQYQCMSLTAQYNTHKNDNNKQQKILKQVDKLWLYGRSLPKRCDAIIKHWQNAGMQTSKITLDRIELTLINRKGKLAKYLAKSLNKKDKRTYLYWKTLYNKPQLLSESHYWEKRGHLPNVIMKVATKRLTNKSLDSAIDLIPQIKKHIGFTQKTRDELNNKIALQAMIKDKKTPQHWLQKINWLSMTPAQQEQILRYLVGKDQWSTIKSLYKQQPPTAEIPLVWQYWYAHSLEQTGFPILANDLFQNIATKRRYYGFLASDKLGLSYSLNHQPLIQDESIISQLKTNNYLMRAKEFYLLGEDLPARREWYQLVKPLSEQQRIGASHIAHQWGWHNRTIITLTMTKERDDLDLRFPTPYQPEFINQSKLNDMTLSWPIAIARQESAFLPRATSSAGAKGLMQLLPSTAKIQAKKEDVSYKSSKQLLEPAFNIKLGTAYLNEMLGLFDNNLAVAAAAYNAGPHRVKHWVKKALSQEKWVESIPYRETRNYVKNVLSYTVIYQHHLAQTQKMPSAAIEPQRMSISN